MYIRRFTYKPEDVDCKLCTEYKKCDRNLMKCPWIAERIEAGAVSYQEAVLTAFPGKGLSFERLLETIQAYPGTFWLNKQHKDRMEMFNHRLGYAPKRNTPVYSNAHPKSTRPASWSQTPRAASLPSAVMCCFAITTG